MFYLSAFNHLKSQQVSHQTAVINQIRTRLTNDKQLNSKEPDQIGNLSDLIRGFAVYVHKA